MLMGTFTHLKRLFVDALTILTKELQQFENMDVSVEGCEGYLEKLRQYCNDLIVKLRHMGEVNDKLLLHLTGMKCKSNSYRKSTVHWQRFLL